MLKRTFAKLAVIAAIIVLLSGCAGHMGADSSTISSSTQAASVAGFGISKDKDFGNIVMEVPTDQIESTGIKCGDSVDITLSNGYTAQDVPSLNEFYARSGALVLCADSDDGCLYSAALYQSGNVVPVNLDVSHTSETYKALVAGDERRERRRNRIVCEGLDRTQQMTIMHETPGKHP